MKRLLKSAALLAALASLFTACSKMEEEMPEQSPAFELFIQQTKTQFNPLDASVSWDKNDQITVLIGAEGKYTNYTFQKNPANDNGFLCADFHPVEGVEYEYNIVYPVLKDWKDFRSDGCAETFLQVAASKNGTLVQEASGTAAHVKPAVTGRTTAVGSAAPSVSLIHLSTLVKVQVQNNSGADLTLNQVELFLNGGDAQFLSGKGLFHPVKGYSHTNNTNGGGIVKIDLQQGLLKAGETAVVYVPCIPFEVKEKSRLIVMAHTSKGDYSHTISGEAGNNQVFNGGAIRKTTLKIESQYYLDYEAKEAVNFAEGIRSEFADGKGRVYFDTPEVPASLFSGSGVQKVRIPAAVERIGDSAFNGCKSLKTVVFEGNPNLREIGAQAFNGCTGLFEITLPASLRKIEAEALYNVATAGHPLVVHMLGKTVPEVHAHSFDYTPGGLPRLKAIVVPVGTLKSYQTNWKGKAFAVRLTETEPVE